MTQEEKENLCAQHSEAVDQILETILKVRGDEYVTRLMVVYATILIARIGHVNGLPTAQLGANGVQCAFKSWGITDTPEALDLTRDASALVAKSLYSIPNAG
jgi:hypothetical protein